MSYTVSFLFPWLVMVLLLDALARRHGNWRMRLGLALAALVIVLIPVRGLPLGRWIAGLNYQPSIPFLGFLSAFVWNRSMRTGFLRSNDTAAGALFGSILGIVLYPLALGLGNFDPYSLGWTFSVIFPTVALITIGLIWKGNRFGFLLLLSIVAYDLHWLESTNLWDYLVDPIYWLVSLVSLCRTALQGRRRGSSNEKIRAAQCSADL